MSRADFYLSFFNWNFSILIPFLLVTTGEESERTVHSARAKLYVMSSDASNTWKERGTGTIRCNVPKKSMLDRGYRDDDKKGARLGE